MHFVDLTLLVTFQKHATVKLLHSSKDPDRIQRARHGVGVVRFLKILPLDLLYMWILATPEVPQWPNI